MVGGIERQAVNTIGVFCSSSVAIYAFMPNQSAAKIISMDLHFVWNKQKYYISPGCCFSNGHNLKAVSNSCILISIIAIANEYLCNTTITQVLQLRSTLVAISNER